MSIKKISTLILLSTLTMSCSNNPLEVERIEIMSPTSSEIMLGGSLQLEVNVVPSEIETTLIWTSSDEDIATVNNGLVSAHEEGEVTITVSVEEQKNISDSILLSIVPSLEERKLNALLEGLSNQNYTMNITDNDVDDTSTIVAQFETKVTKKGVVHKTIDYTFDEEITDVYAVIESGEVYQVTPDLTTTPVTLVANDSTPSSNSLTNFLAPVSFDTSYLIPNPDGSYGIEESALTNNVLVGLDPFLTFTQDYLIMDASTINLEINIDETNNQLIDATLTYVYDIYGYLTGQLTIHLSNFATTEWMYEGAIFQENETVDVWSTYLKNLVDEAYETFDINIDEVPFLPTDEATFVDNGIFGDYAYANLNFNVEDTMMTYYDDYLLLLSSEGWIDSGYDNDVGFDIYEKAGIDARVSIEYFYDDFFEQFIINFNFFPPMQ